MTPYAEYIVDVHQGADGLTPRKLSVQEDENGTGFIQVSLNSSWADQGIGPMLVLTRSNTFLY